MARVDLGIGQGERKECYAGNPSMNRYGIFNGLQRPLRIGDHHEITMLGYDAPATAPGGIAIVDVGDMTSEAYYSYRYCPLSARYLRPVPVNDETKAFTRGNPSPVSSAIYLGVADQACSVFMQSIPRDDVTHLGLYRSWAAMSSSRAVVGPWALTAVLDNVSCSHSTTLSVVDVTPDTELGELVELDNFPPNAYSCATEIDDYVFAGGRVVVGNEATNRRLCTVVEGSSIVTLTTPGRVFHDGIRGWYFVVVGDSGGGVDGLAHYFASYVDDLHLRLEDDTGATVTYSGSMAGTDREFRCFLDGRLLRWCKRGEPESWPTANAVRTQGEIVGIARIPNQSILVLITDKPEVRIFDLSVIGTPEFKTSLMISNEFIAWQPSLTPVEGRLRGTDPGRGAIWETDGSSVRDITRDILSDIWSYLSQDPTAQQNWHAVYDANQKIYGAFVTLTSSVRTVDFVILQNVRTGRWFFAWPKDMLCSCQYLDPKTGLWMALGGTQGLGNSGGTWGRIWAPEHYNEWISPGYLVSGDIVSSTATIVTVDVTGGVNLQTVGDGLKGRWVLVTDANGKQEQIASISANAANTFTVDAVYGGLNPVQFDPVPQAGWKFYLGLIECRWGPKRFTFDDPSIFKQVLDISARIKNTDATKPPFARLYKGVADGYERQIALESSPYVGGATQAEGWRNTTEQIEPSLQWGMSLIDRSYGGIEIEDLTLIFKPAENRR